jgi:hypothetical protein
MTFQINEKARGIISAGGIKVKVRRAGMLQFQEFKVKRVGIGKGTAFLELWLDNVVDLSELLRLSNEFGLPFEAHNGRVFPNGLGAKDFIGL